jgi:uncharacterized membrane protein
MSTVQKTIEVKQPVSTVYNQWTQFESFPEFMEGVESIQQLDDKRVHWHAKIGGVDREWDAEITEQIPDQRISWRSVNGPDNGGTVTFEPLGSDRTRLTVQMAYEPEGMVEKAGDALGAVERRVEGDLERFREFIEKRGQESGAWRGEIHGRSVS